MKKFQAIFQQDYFIKDFSKAYDENLIKRSQEVVWQWQKHLYFYDIL